MSTDIVRPTIKARDMLAVLKGLPPDKSVLIVGPHGIGKSQIIRQIADYFGIGFLDRRLAQMTEGDMIGLPLMSDDITRFLPVDWFKKACTEPVVLLLDELNRATPEIMNAAFQIVLDREMNGNVLHPETRVIACVNAGSHYAVNEMDPALINRFAIFKFEPDNEDWKIWARGHGVDELIVDYIHHYPNDLREKDLNNMEPMTAYPTPRGWESVDRCLKHANIAPSDVCGKELPSIFFPMVASLVGYPIAISFTRFVKQYKRIVTAEDVLNHWDEKADRIKSLSHDAVVALLDKIGDHCGRNDWSEKNVKNLVEFAEACFTGEDWMHLFKAVVATKNLNNIRLFHTSAAPDRLVKLLNEADSITGRNS